MVETVDILVTFADFKSRVLADIESYSKNGSVNHFVLGSEMVIGNLKLTYTVMTRNIVIRELRYNGDLLTSFAYSWNK